VVFGKLGRRAVKIALLVEGRTRPSSEEKTIKTIVRKIIPSEVGIESRLINRGDLLTNEKKVYACISNILQNHPDISKIVVCVDSHCTQKEEIDKEVRKVEGNLKKKVNIPVSYVVIEHALEGWLLADPESVIGHLSPKVRIDIPSSYTKECKPEEKMKEIFRKSNREFVHMRDNYSIAERLNIERAASANDSFANFIEKIKDP